MANKFHLRTFEEVPAHTHVLAMIEVDYIVWLMVPKDLPASCELFQVDEVSPTPSEIEYADLITREQGRPWLRILSELFDLSLGNHLYQFSFVDTETDDVFSRFFSYSITGTNYDPDYIYMRRPKESN